MNIEYIQTYIRKYISRLDYASQLWSPHKIDQITQIEKSSGHLQNTLQGCVNSVIMRDFKL